MDFLDAVDERVPDVHRQGDPLALVVRKVPILAVHATFVVSYVHEEDAALLEIAHAHHLLRT